MKRILLLAVCAAMLITSQAATANAQGGGYGFGFYPLYGRDHVPYFAMHPPVYYSYPVPRPYGWSPFAYPPSVMTPELEMPAAVVPKTVDNPYVKVNQVPRKPADDNTAVVEPLRITNPFVGDIRLASEQR